MSLDCKRIMASLDPVLSKLEHIFMEGYNTMNKTIDHKSSDVDLVTIYDKRIEDTFKQEINKLYPNHLIIGEESFENRIVLTDTPTWIIDPIDGTTNFIHRFPQCCISIALSHNKLIILAIIFNVVENKKFTAIKDCGAFLNDRKISCSKTTHLKKCLFLTERGGSLTDQSTKYIMDMSKECRGIRMLGSAALNLAYVAAGYADAYCEMGLHIWDMAAGYLILKESGAIVCDPTGKPFDLMSRRVLAVCSEQLKKEITSRTEMYSTINYYERED